ncbi:MAG: hypothetical protein HY719_16945, partial [Planctomycetes bacterium]|nr:hypothetical protein [Planctomycetota bacterium]
MRASLFRWAAIAVVALGALLAGPNRALHAQAADDPLVALKARAQRWESLPPAERLLLCKEIAATGKPEAVDLLGTLALKSADEVSTLRWEINGTKQARYAAKADHKDAEANALTEKEAGLAKSFESAKTLEREFPALWAKLFAAPPTADGARFLARAANQFGQKVLLIDKERWETEWGSVARSKANQRYNTLNTARDAIVQGVARLESAEAVNVIVAEGLKKLTASDQMHARATLVEGLARLKRPESVNALVAVVKDAKELFPVKVAALIGLADLDARDHAADVAAALAEKEWPVVLQAAETLALLDARAQVGDVIKAMEKSDPGSRLREGLDECLSRYTGRRYYGDPKLWRKWWEGGKDAFIASGPLKPGGGDAALPPIGRAEPGAAPGAGAPAAKGPA